MENIGEISSTTMVQEITELDKYFSVGSIPTEWFYIVQNFDSPEVDKKYAQQILDKLYAKCEPIKALVLKKYHCVFLKSANESDYEDAATDGLLKAIYNYDITKDKSFSTFAYEVIKNEMLKVNAKVCTLRYGFTTSVISLNEKVVDDEDFEDTLEDMIPDHDDFYESLLSNEKCKDILSKLKNVLTENEYIILLTYANSATSKLSPNKNKKLLEQLGMSRQSVNIIYRRIVTRFSGMKVLREKYYKFKESPELLSYRYGVSQEKIKDLVKLYEYFFEGAPLTDNINFSAFRYSGAVTDRILKARILDYVDFYKYKFNDKYPSLIQMCKDLNMPGITALGYLKQLNLTDFIDCRSIKTVTIEKRHKKNEENEYE